MKIAEAELRIRHLEWVVGKTHDDVRDNLQTVKGDVPELDPGQLNRDAEQVRDEILTLQQRVTRTRAITPLGNGMISDARHHRDHLGSERYLHELRNARSQVQWANRERKKNDPEREAHGDLTQARQDLRDELNERYELDIQIALAEWATDLVD